MRKALGVTLAAVMLLIVAGCAPLGSGRVTAKTFIPAHDGVVLVGKVWTTTHYDDAWSLNLEDCSTKPCRERDVEVSSAVYEETQIGETYTVPADNRPFPFVQIILGVVLLLVVSVFLFKLGPSTPDDDEESREEDPS